MAPKGDLFALDLVHWKWTEFNMDEAEELERQGHAITVSDGNTVFLWGGRDETGCPCLTLHSGILPSGDSSPLRLSPHAFCQSAALQR